MFRLAAKKTAMTFVGTTAAAATKQSAVRTGFRAFLSSNAASTEATPSVKDLLINLTFIDPSGARRKATGMVGKYLFYLLKDLLK